MEHRQNPDMTVMTAPLAAPRPKVVPLPVTTRDPRLDFFRGIALCIILITHVPQNPLGLWSPGQFGFSDSAEIFVFCSGMASAIAFGATFDRAGWLIGAGRIAQRVWQIYWVHIGSFVALTALMVFIDSTGHFEKSYVESLNLHRFFDNPEANLVGLVTLTYVPNFFDILPMYLVLLAMVPLVVALHRASPVLALAAVVLTWMVANQGLVDLPAEPWSDREWFFNPLAWQLVFFTGFALMSGWLPAPPLNRNLVIAAIVVVVISVPLAHFRFLNAIPELKQLFVDMFPLRTKTDFGVLRYVHFLALAYLGWAAAGAGGRRLRSAAPSVAGQIWLRVVTVLRKMGQQSLAVFVVGMVAARMIGFGLDNTGRSFWSVALFNVTGLVVLYLAAELVGWFKSQPWRKPS
jgi:hypothetical protein